MIWEVQSFSQSSKNCQSLCSESTSQHLAALTLHPRRRSLMITAFQFWLSASGKTNRAGAGVCQLLAYSLQTHSTGKAADAMTSLHPARGMKWIQRGIETLKLRLIRGHLGSDITGTASEVLPIHKILKSGLISLILHSHSWSLSHSLSPGTFPAVCLPELRGTAQPHITHITPLGLHFHR